MNKTYGSLFSICYIFLAPKNPLMVKVTHRTDSTITLQWDRPETINGVLTQYKVFYENVTKQYHVTIKKNLQNTTLRYQLTNLKFATKYTVTVSFFCFSRMSHYIYSLTILNLSARYGGKCLNSVNRHPSQLSVPEVPTMVPPQLQPYWLKYKQLLFVRNSR